MSTVATSNYCSDPASEDRPRVVAEPAELPDCHEDEEGSQNGKAHYPVPVDGSASARHLMAVLDRRQRRGHVTHYCSTGGPHGCRIGMVHTRCNGALQFESDFARVSHHHRVEQRSSASSRARLRSMLRSGGNRLLRSAWFRRACAIPFVVLSLAYATDSSASAAPAAKTQPDTAMLTRALRTWAKFPVRSSPRPLVLLEGYVLGPEGGFADDNSKTAFIGGEITPPSSWPVSATSTMGFPIVKAAAAFKTLTIPTGNVLGTPPPLSTTGVHLGSGRFLTDRGYRVLPAWIFKLSGVANPAKVLAVRPSAIYYAPSTPEGTSPAELFVIVGGAGRHIVANFVGAPAGTGPCTASYTLSIKESKQAVAVAVIAHSHGNGNKGCLLVGYLRHTAAELTAPLGARVVVDAKSEGPAAATRTSPS